ncbi:Hypothetical Protein RRSL_01530 [Ralstonia solanacearum UW551]|uniref:DUF2339 domain-containing protein n=1 Tax=Ralstonia solanacearum (strain UW551) TaxID=342110 RepID=A0AB33VC41_RALSU|nr:DUF2339 domain-containing protein [Ralstonia solanacearum]EAP71525.1 Hypothetical Protein RRSL_01530 [Ralstonia solanacearum UW551]
MRWIFGIIGLILGAASGGVTGAIIGALIGVGLASFILHLDKRASSQWADQDAAASPDAATQPGVPPITERVTRLEHEVALLRRQIAELKGQSFATASPTREASEPAAQAPVLGLAPTIAEALPPVISPAPAIAPQPEAVPAPWPASEPPPLAPTWADQAVAAARDWLLGGNSVVRVGILILFFGVAFLLKYAADNSLLPIEFRLAGVALASIVLLVIGWRLRDKRPGYALVLQGGGVGVLYLTVFAATRMVPLLAPGAAFALLVLICALAAGLAVRQNAPALAFTGSAGGFLAPILISTGAGSHVALFSYYALLNAGIFAIAWFRAWRMLNLLGFVFHFRHRHGNGGALPYEPGACWQHPTLFWALFLLEEPGPSHLVLCPCAPPSSTPQTIIVERPPLVVLGPPPWGAKRGFSRPPPLGGPHNFPFSQMGLGKPRGGPPWRGVF